MWDDDSQTAHIAMNHSRHLHARKLYTIYNVCDLTNYSQPVLNQQTPQNTIQISKTAKHNHFIKEKKSYHHFIQILSQNQKINNTDTPT